MKYKNINLIKMRLDISVTLRFPPFLYNSIWIEEERRETETSSLILIRLIKTPEDP